MTKRRSRNDPDVVQTSDQGGRQESGAESPLVDFATEGLRVQSSDDIVVDEFDNIIPTHSYGMVPMVALGGSAGGIKALQAFFAAMPPDTGFIFVVILHLSSEHESMLAEILQKTTSMKVVQVATTIAVQPNWVYVIPPRKVLVTVDGCLKLTEKMPEQGRRTTVDEFLLSMADAYGARSAAIIISGTNVDGAMGIKRIKERGGLTIAQDPEEAEFSGMPQAAIATGMVDWVLGISEMPSRIQAYMQNDARQRLPAEDAPQPVRHDDEGALLDVLAYLRTRTNRDFSYYKRATILRRIARRLQIHGRDDLESYLEYLRTHPGESDALLKDMLISVTNFFRDREAFRSLEAEVPRLFQGKGPGDTVRVWVPGCATGEEAYSIAIILSEHTRTLEAPPAIQVFATDLDDDAIRNAREGLFPETITADVSEDRIRRFFLREHRGFRVRREVREIVLFAIHDLLKDSPFSRLDMISCRNLLIYLNRDAQIRAFEIFQFALNVHGILFLGSSESVDDDSVLFSVVNKKYRIYSRRQSFRVGLPVPTGPSSLFLAQNQRDVPTSSLTSPDATGQAELFAAIRVEPRGESRTWAEAHFRLIERFAPPSLIVSAEHEILHLSNNAGRFLQLAGGEPSRNLLQLIHPTLRIELRAALYSTAQSHEATQVTGPADIGGAPVSVTIHVMPADDVIAGGMLIVFDAHTCKPGDADPTFSVETEPAARQLELELERVKAHLRDTIEQYEASTEELKAGNEELQAMNEELRSATEELETGREELQSINEELTTVNQELKSKVEELGTANSDLHNLMASTAIATIFLDRDLRIKRFTPRAIEIFRLIPTDIGRPLHDLSHKLLYPELLVDTARVLETLVPIERKIEELGGRWFLGRILPYRTIEDRIAGAVLTFVDITEQYRAEHAALESAAEFRSIFELSTVGMAQVDLESGRIVRGNKKFCSILNSTHDDLQKIRIYELIDAAEGQVNQERLCQLREGKILEFSIEKELNSGHALNTWLDCTVTIERAQNGQPRRFVVAIVDVTQRKNAESAVRKSEEQLRHSNLALDERVRERTQKLLASEMKLREIAETSDRRADQLQSLTNELISAEQRERRRIASVLHDHIQQLLVAAKFRAEELKDDGKQKPLRLVANQLVAIMDEAINVTRTLSVELVPPLLYDDGLAAALQWLATKFADQYQLEITTETAGHIDQLRPELRDLAFQSVRELLLNVVKHSKSKQAMIHLRSADHDTVLEVIDNGVGFTIGNEGRRSKSFGLSQIRERIEAVGGSFSIQTAAGDGTYVTIRLPNRSP